MPNTNYTQAALAADQDFIARAKSSLIKQALVVFDEAQSTPPTTTQTVRRNYAFQVLSSPDSEAARVARLLVFRANVNNFTTSYDFEKGHVVTTSGDPDILSQVATDWNIYARL